MTVLAGAALIFPSFKEPIDDSSILVSFTIKSCFLVSLTTNSSTLLGDSEFLAFLKGGIS